MLGYLLSTLLSLSITFSAVKTPLKHKRSRISFWHQLSSLNLSLEKHSEVKKRQTRFQTEDLLSAWQAR